MWHNELINIWTHLIGAIIILSLVFYVYFHYEELFRPKAIETFNGMDQLPIALEKLREFYQQAIAIEE